LAARAPLRATVLTGLISAGARADEAVANRLVVRAGDLPTLKLLPAFPAPVPFTMIEPLLIIQTSEQPAARDRWQQGGNFARDETNASLH